MRVKYEEGTVNESQLQLSTKTPVKEIKLTYSNELKWDHVNLKDPIDLAVNFGKYLNSFFYMWNAKNFVWVDAEKYAYTTEQILEEFIQQVKADKVEKIKSNPGKQSYINKQKRK